LGTHEFAGGGARPEGMAVASQSACGSGEGEGNGGGGGSGGGNGGVCEASADSYTPTWHPPNGSGAGACTSSELAQFETMCLGASATKAMCTQFATQSPGCMQCMLTDSDAPGYGPFVRYDS